MERIAQRMDLDRLVATGSAVVIDVADDSSQASRTFSGEVDRVAAAFSSVRFARMQLPEDAALAALFDLTAAPSVLIFRGGVGLFCGPVTFGSSQFEAMLRRALALDMDAVRRQMDRDRAAMAGAAAFRACPMSRRGEFPPE